MSQRWPLYISVICARVRPMRDAEDLKPCRGRRIEPDAQVSAVAPALKGVVSLDISWVLGEIS